MKTNPRSIFRRSFLLAACLLSASYLGLASPASAQPAAPSNLTANAVASTKINLTWTDNAGNETGFKIERKTGAVGTFAQIATTGANVTSYNNTGLTANTTYYYRVRANNGSGNSAYSNEASAQTQVAGTPAAPYGLTAAVVSSTQINLAWTDDSNNETGFKIERKTGSGGTYAQIATTGANVASYNSTGLTAGTTYYYRVRAYNASGDTTYTNEANATTSGSPPAAPSGLTATSISSSQINLAWTDNANNETGVKVERKAGSGGTYAQIATTASGATSYSSTGLSASTTYYYRVRATNASGDSAYSNEANATTSGSLPAAPSGLTATSISSSQINLAWTDNANNETGVKVERKTGAAAYAQIALTGANTTSYNNTGLSASTTYDYRVRATNGNGDSAYSNVASAATSGGTTTTLWDTIGVFENTNLANVLDFFNNDVKRTAAPKATAVVFFGKTDNWSTWRSTGMTAIDTFKTWLQGGRRLVVSFRPWPDNVWPTFNLQGANTGSGYFAEYATFFAQVKTYCDTNGINPSQFIFRPAQEANGKFFTWTFDGTSTNMTNGVTHSEGRTTAQRTADYIAMMQDIFAAAAQEMPGSTRAWCLLARLGTKSFNEAAYPGNAYVDVIDLDNYGTANTQNDPWTDAQRQTAWNRHIDPALDTPNLVWQRDFASARSKKVGFTEWGITWRFADKIGTEDDPIFINGMFDWMEQQLLPAGLMTLSNGDPSYAPYFHDQANNAAHQLYGLPSNDPYYSPRARDAFNARVGGGPNPQ